MANTAWVAQRRENVTQVLVESLQKLGNANLLRDQTFEQGQGCCVAVQTSSPSSSNKSPNESTSPQSRSLDSPSTNHEYQQVVPRLDIESLQKLSEGCRSLGLDCRYVCLNCGNPASEPPSSSRDAISIISAKTSDFSISNNTNINQNNKRLEITDQTSTNQQNQSNFILENLGFQSSFVKVCEDETGFEVEEELQDETKKGSITSVVSVCLADPEEFSKEEKVSNSEESLDHMVMPPLVLTQTKLTSCTEPGDIDKEASPLPTTIEINKLHQFSVRSENSHQPNRGSLSSPSESKDSKDRRRSLGFSLKPTPEEMSEAMPTMYRIRRARRKTGVFGRFLGLFGSGKNRGHGHFSKHEIDKPHQSRVPSEDAHQPNRSSLQTQLTPEEISEAMPTMYRTRRARKKTGVFGRFLGLFGSGKRKNRGHGHFSHF